MTGSILGKVLHKDASCPHGYKLCSWTTVYEFTSLTKKVCISKQGRCVFADDKDVMAESILLRYSHFV